MAHPANRMLSTEAMTSLFGPVGTMESMLAFEAALAMAEAEEGAIPKRSAESIAAACKADRFDPEAIARRAARAGNLAIPLLEDLVAEVAKKDPAAAAQVHRGATSQDVVDTGLVLQLRKATDLLQEDLERIESALRELARAHAETALLGRTLLQPGPPLTFGLKAAHWHAAVRRGRRRLATAAEGALFLQFGGAVGTLSALGDKALGVEKSLAGKLNLKLPAASWHTQRDRIVALAAAASILVGSLGKMARDLSLLMQAEVGEAAEPAKPGRGHSSAMPHKRNPVGCMVALSAANRAPGLLSTLLVGMVQEHERALGGWQAEWPTLPELFEAAAGAASSMVEVAEELAVNPDAMLHNLEQTRGIVFSELLAVSLREKMGKSAADHWIRELTKTVSETGKHLQEVILETPEICALLDEKTRQRIFDWKRATGITSTLIERLLQAEE